MTQTGDDPMTLHKTLVRACDEKMVELLKSVGTEACNRMRSDHDYTDRTGALTSSMGCVVSKGGQVVWGSGFDTFGGGTAGSDAGRLYAQQLAKETQQGVVELIVLEGMNYGGHVEDKINKSTNENYRVVRFTEEDVRRNIEQGLENIL